MDNGQPINLAGEPTLRQKGTRREQKHRELKLTLHNTDSDRTSPFTPISGGSQTGAPASSPGPPPPPAPQPAQFFQQPAPSRVVGKDQSISYQTGSATGCEIILVVISVLCLIITLPFSLICVFVVVRQFERAVMFRNGRLHKTHPIGPGLIFRLPCVDELRFTDLRTICYAVPPQEALTKDSLTVSVDAVVFYKITDPLRAVIKVSDYKTSTHYLAATMLRNAIGTRKLTELLSNRPAVSFDVFTHMRQALLDWGITAVKVEIKDIRLPVQLQKAMAAEAESSRLANAKIIVAKAEIEATKSLEKATTVLMENPYCMQLRYLQSLHLIASSNTHTIVFPSSIVPK